MNCLPVPGFPNYEVSDCGKVFSLNYNKTGQRKELKLVQHSTGYIVVCLSEKNRTKTFQVHRLVMQAHIGPCPSGMQVCHNDGNKANNALSNLRYGTAVENWKDRATHNTRTEGSKHGRAKLNEAQVLSIRAQHASGCSYSSLARSYGTSVTLIRDIVLRRLWTHI